MMKYKITIFLVFFAFLIGFSMIYPLPSYWNESDDSRYYFTLHKFSDYVRKKVGYKIQAVGGSVNPDGSIKVIALAFDAPQFSGNDSARRELIELCQEAIQFFNNDTYVKENRHDEPLSWENLDIFIFYRDENENKLYSPNISAISLYNQKVMFFFKNPRDEYQREVIKESIEEALNKVKAEQ